MNMVADSATFAVACVQGEAREVRSLIFGCTDRQMIQDTLDLVDENDGAEWLRSVLMLRLKVLDMLLTTDRVAAGEQAPVVRRPARKVTTAKTAKTTRTAKAPRSTQPPAILSDRSPVTGSQLSFAGLVAPVRDGVAPDPLDSESARTGGEVSLVVATDADEGIAGEPSRRIEPPPAHPDPRPALVLPMPAPARTVPPFYSACAEALPWLLWAISEFWEGESAVVPYRALRGRRDSPVGRWALSRWYARAWEDGSAPETAGAAIGLRVDWTRRAVIITAEKQPSASG